MPQEGISPGLRDCHDAQPDVYVLPSRADLIGSFTPELFRALEAKRKVLGLEADPERHLRVLVERWDRSNEPEDTPAPEIPAEM
jgi:hypothetical protein